MFFFVIGAIQIRNDDGDERCVIWMCDCRVILNAYYYYYYYYKLLQVS